ncbi:Uncharacterized protein dnl_05300 [Desulfonema limicola]|uniref:Uncharacterized protein n=1 Tax=Desulfonema limicola TaxID=45656 RepID=A0A975B3Y6_9BACT|nr:hypothetical protein [Desulfonema limicola]QTA78309.1 Uncharacterized protein dnl_05300 [Desulfonema limicola]
MAEQLTFNFPRRKTFFSGRILIQLKLIFSNCRLPAAPPAEQIKLPLQDFNNHSGVLSNIIIKKETLV